MKTCRSRLLCTTTCLYHFDTSLCLFRTRISQTAPGPGFAIREGQGLESPQGCPIMRRRWRSNHVNAVSALCLTLQHHTAQLYNIVVSFTKTTETTFFGIHRCFSGFNALDCRPGCGQLCRLMSESVPNRPYRGHAPDPHKPNKRAKRSSTPSQSHEFHIRYVFNFLPAFDLVATVAGVIAYHQPEKCYNTYNKHS